MIGVEFFVDLEPTILNYNSDCFRGRDYPLKKIPGTSRIVVLGDSFMEGLGVNDNETFSHFLETFIKLVIKRGKFYSIYPVYLD